jgi:signal transduction histidine kinase/CheY-like chemotaxis protein
MKPIPDNAATSPEHQRLAELEEEVRRLQRTNRVLMDRVEQRINDEGGAFAAFQAASRLEKTIAERTAELRVLNERLEHELDLRRNFEGALLRAKQEAEDAMASRTRFLAAASHDLRQPLNAAVLYLEAMDRKQLSTANEDSFRGIGLALDTLDSLLSVLLDISRLDSGGLHPEPCHFALQALFSRLAQEYGSLAEAKQLRLEVEDTDAVVHTDMMLLETVLRNLLSNAIKYTDRGKISMAATPAAHGLRIAIEDTGIGIPAEHLDRIFDEFWRAPGSSVSEKNSMGLGLSIVQRISRLLDSNIAVNSTPGSGSRFSLQVPCGDSRLLADVDSPALVDDNSEVLRSMERLLKSWDCEVVAATGVEEVLTTIIDRDLSPQLLLTDYHLADGAKGTDAVRAINAEITCPVPAIMISSDNSEDLRSQLETLDIPLLTKPIQPARLRALMLHLLADSAGV